MIAARSTGAWGTSTRRTQRGVHSSYICAHRGPRHSPPTHSQAASGSETRRVNRGNVWRVHVCQSPLTRVCVIYSASTDIDPVLISCSRLAGHAESRVPGICGGMPAALSARTCWVGHTPTSCDAVYWGMEVGGEVAAGPAAPPACTYLRRRYHPTTRLTRHRAPLSANLQIYAYNF